MPSLHDRSLEITLTVPLFQCNMAVVHLLFLLSVPISNYLLFQFRVFLLVKQIYSVSSLILTLPFRLQGFHFFQLSIFGEKKK